MDIKRIHKILSGGILTLPAFIVLAFFARIFAGTTFREYIPWIVFIIQIGIAILLIRISYEYQIIKKRTSLPATFFILFTASNPVLYNNLEGSISAFIMVLCLVIFFKNYQDPQSQVSSFNIASILTIGGIFCWQPLLFFIPLFWIGFKWFKAFNARSFFASLLGILTVYLFLFAWSVYSKNSNCFWERLPQFKEVVSVEWVKLQWYNWVVVAYLIFLLLFSVISIFVLGSFEKIRTTLSIKFLFLLAAVSFVLACFFDSTVNDIQAIIYFPIASISGFYFAMNNSNKLITYLLIFTFLFFITSYIFRLGMFDFLDFTYVHTQTHSIAQFEHQQMFRIFNLSKNLDNIFLPDNFRKL